MARSADSRRRLIEAAITLFSERGYEKATTRELAERARCSEALIYKHFSGKRDLLVAVLEYEREKGVDRAPPPADPSLEAQVVHMFREGVTHIWRRRDLFRVCMSLAPIDAELGRLMDSIEQQSVQSLAGRLRGLQDWGLLAADTDIDAAASAMDMLIVGTGYLWQVVFRRDPEQIEERVVSIARHFSESLAPRHSVSQPNR
jgi:AcrR family transcriptional regulator